MPGVGTNGRRPVDLRRRATSVFRRSTLLRLVREGLDSSGPGGLSLIILSWALLMASNLSRMVATSFRSIRRRSSRVKERLRLKLRFSESGFSWVIFCLLAKPISSNDNTRD